MSKEEQLARRRAILADIVALGEDDISLSAIISACREARRVAIAEKLCRVDWTAPTDVNISKVVFHFEGVGYYNLFEVPSEAYLSLLEKIRDEAVHCIEVHKRNLKSIDRLD